MSVLFASAWRRWSSMSLVLRILVGLLVGALAGLFLPSQAWIGIFGQLFVGALKAVAPVLVALLVASSIAGARSGMGSRFRTVIVLYLLSTLVAALTAVAASFLFPVTLTLHGEAALEAAPSSLSDVFSSLLSNLVANPVQALASGNYLGILFWSVLGGLALKHLSSDAARKGVKDLADAASLVVKWIIQFAPLGVMGLVFTAVSGSGLEIFTEYGRLLALLVGCMLFTALVSNPLIATLFMRRNPYPLLFQCLKESGLNALFTRSSAANIPINMALCRKLGLEEDFYSVSIPLGATINMNGAAVTITVMTLAVAHTVGAEAGFLAAALLSVVATLGACGASGVAGGSLLLIPMACSFFGIGADAAMQAVAVGFIIGVVQDSVETALNSSGDVFFTAVAEYHDVR